MIKEPNRFLKDELRRMPELKNANLITVRAIKQEHIIRYGFGYHPDIDYGLDIEEEYTRNLKENKKLVEEILSTWGKSRNNDVLLYFEFLRTKFEEIKVTSSKEYVIFKFPKKIIKYLNSPETITRIRRKFNEKGLYLPTSERVLLRRMKRQKVLAKYFKK